MSCIHDPIDKDRHGTMSQSRSLALIATIGTYSEVGWTFSAEQEVHVMAPRRTGQSRRAGWLDRYPRLASPGPMNFSFSASEGMEKNGIDRVEPRSVLYI